MSTHIFWQDRENGLDALSTSLLTPEKNYTPNHEDTLMIEFLTKVTTRPLKQDYRGRNLVHCDLRGADLRDQDLRHTCLRGADLREADLSGADLTLADLRCANLANVQAVEARFFRSKLSYATLNGGYFRQATFEEASFHYTSIRYANFVGASLWTLRQANLFAQPEDLRGADTEGTKIVFVHEPKTCPLPIVALHLFKAPLGVEMVSWG